MHRLLFTINANISFSVSSTETSHYSLQHSLNDHTASKPMSLSVISHMHKISILQKLQHDWRNLLSTSAIEDGYEKKSILQNKASMKLLNISATADIFTLSTIYN